MATPTSLFIERGQTEQVIVEVVDQQGNPLLEDLTFSGGTGLTIVEDTAYLRTSTSSQQPRYERAFNVTANDLAATSFTFSSGNVTREVSVRATPPTIEIPAATVTSTGPNASDPTTLTVPAPYIFPTHPTVTWVVGVDTVSAIVLERAADGRTLTILPPPGVAAPGAVSVALDFTPEVALATTTDVAVTTSPTVPPLPGSGDITTAPIISIGPLGGGLWDGGAFTGTMFGADQYYQFTVPADGDYTISVDWTVAVDIDYFLCSDVACSEPDFTGATGDHPEIHDFTLTAGTTYYLIANLFEGPNPPWVRIEITPAAEEAH